MNDLTSTRKESLINAEKLIDEEFVNTPLMHLNYSQAIWTVLSVAEDMYWKHTVLAPLPHEAQHIYLDGLINSIAHPTKALFHKRNEPTKRVKIRMFDEHYGWVISWLEQSQKYGMFCSIFPLWHKGKLDLNINGNTIEPEIQEIDSNNYAYEAYNRFTRKDGNIEERHLEPDIVIEDIIKNTTQQDLKFSLNFNAKLVKKLRHEHGKTLGHRYVLPSHWTVGGVQFQDFKTVFTTIQAMLYGWHIARVYVASKKVHCLGYPSAVWVVDRSELVARLLKYTDVDENVISKILSYLTFGEHDIRDPDIALQPLVELTKNCFALSPLLWVNSNAERNLCALFNKIPELRQSYLELTLEKEQVLRQEITEALTDYSYEIRFGKLSDTDLDIAIIDRANKICACIELKWFIEPAEIREVIERSAELKKGVRQAKTIRNYFDMDDSVLMSTVLDIDKSYRFASFVGSRNWIGYHDVQDLSTPIIKIWHFIKILKELGLGEALNWLENRSYLPVNGKEFTVVLLDIEFGNWKSKWYGMMACEDEQPV